MQSYFLKFMFGNGYGRVIALREIPLGEAHMPPWSLVMEVVGTPLSYRLTHVEGLQMLLPPDLRILMPLYWRILMVPT